MRRLLLSVAGGVLVSPVAAMALAGTANAATPSAPTTAAAHPSVAAAPSGTSTKALPKVLPNTLAPSCVSFSQYNHNFYTNVYIDNSCRTGQRIKIIMANGTDSNCVQIAAGTIDYFFRSNSDNGLQPRVTRIDAC